MNKLFAGIVLVAISLAQSGGQPRTLWASPDGFSLGYGSTFSKDLGVTPAQLQADPSHPGYYLDGVYEVIFSLDNYNGPYPGYFPVELSFGTQELCSADGWAIRNMTQITVVCPSPAYIVADQALPSGGPVQGAKNLVVNFSVPGWAINFKNVSVVFYPGS